MLKNKILLLGLIAVLLSSAYYIDINGFKENNILRTFAIEELKNEVYYFPAKKFKGSDVEYQPIERFDLIFVGHEINTSSKNLDIYQNVSALVPGRYTHVLTYIGKDKNGFAYAVEMNADENQTFSINIDGLDIGGKLYLFCLGSDFNDNPCPHDNYSYGMKIYDYMWAKALNPKLKKQLFQYEDQLIAKIKEDLESEYPFQLPFDVGMETSLIKYAKLVEDEHQNGSDCVSYFVSLFEEIAKVCPENIRIDASSLMLYYLNDPIGQKAILPVKYNHVYNKDIYMADIFRYMGYSFVDNKVRQTQCSDKKVVSGVPTPDLLFNSPDMIDIKSFKKIYDTNLK